MILTASKIFRQKLETTSFQVGDSVTLECEVEGDSADDNGFWYRNDELVLGDIEKNTVLVRYGFIWCDIEKNTVLVRYGLIWCDIEKNTLLVRYGLIWCHILPLRFVSASK